MKALGSAQIKGAKEIQQPNTNSNSGLVPGQENKLLKKHIIGTIGVI